MTLRLLHALQDHARVRSNAPAAVGVGTTENALSWAQLNDRVTTLATTLRQHLPPDATVLLCYPNRPEFIAAFLGVLAAGTTVFPISADSAGPELKSAAERSAAAAAIVLPETANHLQPLFRESCSLPELGAGALLLSGPHWCASSSKGPALLLQSSGTTSRPKIVRRDGESLDAVSWAMVKACGFTAADHVLASVPLCHSYGLEHGLLAPIAAGSCVHVCRKFDLPLVLHELREGGITVLPGVPFMFDMLSHSQGPFPSLRKAYSAGGPLPGGTYEAFLQTSGVRLGQVYGATEIGSVTFNDPMGAHFVPGGVGLPLDGVSIRILDADEPQIDQPLPVGEEGQVAIAAASMLSGYIDDASAPPMDGYYLTGDLGALDASGALTITGRLKLLIDVGGRKVNPTEVEDVLRQYPGVGACVVLPMRLSETVCRLKAILTPARPDLALAAQDLRQFARERLSAYKVPRVFEVRPSLPTSPSGKVLRRLVEAS
jgi:acyl-CoA synthetase (AMP-forming)/AMP-acid ligase II